MNELAPEHHLPTLDDRRFGASSEFGGGARRRDNASARSRVHHVLAKGVGVDP